MSEVGIPKGYIAFNHFTVTLRNLGLFDLRSVSPNNYNNFMARYYWGLNHHED